MRTLTIDNLNLATATICQAAKIAVVDGNRTPSMRDVKTVVSRGILVVERLFALVLERMPAGHSLQPAMCSPHRRQRQYRWHAGRAVSPGAVGVRS